MTMLAELYATPWAIRPELLAAILGYVERHDVTPAQLARAAHFDPAVQAQAEAARWNRYAVHQQSSVLVEGSQALYRRGATAILPITGPIVRRGNLMSSLSGGPMTSVELLAKDLTRALEDPTFRAVVLDVDSPGGEASGIAELAQIIMDGRSQKPLTAYVGDLAASAAYWLASAASEVVLNKTAAVGSIGVVMAVPDPKAQPREYVEIVSSVSPNKRPDPNSKDGRAQLQTLVDALGDLFVDDIAAQRAVSRETVLEQFGQGGLLVGADAVERGMADRLGSFEDVMAQVADETSSEAPDRAPDELQQKRQGRSRPLVAEMEVRVTPVWTASEPDGGPNMALLDSLKLLVASADAPASADREAQIVTQHITPEPAAPPPQAPASQPSAVMSSADATLQARLVAAEAENARLRFAQIQARAEAFARARAEELRTFPPEMPHLIALYCLLASDDETHGPIQAGSGKSATRISYLENLMASRASRKELTEDVFGDTVAHVLAERARPRRTEDDEPDPERLAELLGHTMVGRQILRESAFTASGQSAK